MHKFFCHCVTFGRQRHKTTAFVSLATSYFKLIQHGIYSPQECHFILTQRPSIHWSFHQSVMVSIWKSSKSKTHKVLPSYCIAMAMGCSLFHYSYSGGGVIMLTYRLIMDLMTICFSTHTCTVYSRTGADRHTTHFLPRSRDGSTASAAICALYQIHMCQYKPRVTPRLAPLPGWQFICYIRAQQASGP